MAGPFKMKGSPFQRNFGIGSPMKQDVGPKGKPAIDKDGDGIPLGIDINDNDAMKVNKSNQGSPKPKSTYKPKSPEATKSPGKPEKTKPVEESIKKDDVTMGDVVQTLIAPNVNVKKTIKVVKRYTPKKVKKVVKNVIENLKTANKKIFTK